MPPGGYVQGTAGSIQCSANISIADSTEGSLGNWACFIHLLISEAPFQARGTQFSGLPRLPLPSPNSQRKGSWQALTPLLPPQPGPGLQLEVQVLPTTTLLPSTQAIQAKSPHLGEEGQRHSQPQAAPDLLSSQRRQGPAGVAQGRLPTRNAPGGSRAQLGSPSRFQTLKPPPTRPPTPTKLGQKLHILDHTGVCVC